MKNIILIVCSLLLFSCNNEQPQKETKAIERKIEKVLERYPDGKKKIEGETVNGQRHGIWKYYYENGFLWSEGKYWYGERRGFSIIYFESGKKKMEGTYDKDLKIGIWKLWNEDGSLNQEIDLNKMLTSADSVKLELKASKK